MSYRIDEMTYWGGNPIAPCSEETAQDLIGKWEKIGKEWDSKKKEIVDSIFEIKENDMEKKKMTKAEAFKYLDEAKIYVDGQIEAVLEKLFEIGFTWWDGGKQVDLGWSSDDEVYGLIIHDGELCWVDKECRGSWFANLYMPNEQRAEDVLSIEIVEDTKPDCERNEHVKALQEFIAKSGYIDCIIISKNDIGILKK